jgi:hypothetical protein
LRSCNWPFWILVQQQSAAAGLGVRVEPLAELAERLASGSRRDLGIDLHGDRDLAVPQDLHRYARVYVKSSQQRAAGLPGAMSKSPVIQQLMRDAYPTADVRHMV